MSDNLLHFNGINGANGQFLLPPTEPQRIVQVARGERLAKSDFHLQDIQTRVTQKNLQHLGTAENIDPTKLEECGWGIIFAYNANPAIREALAELLDHRKAQATRQDERFYREFLKADGYRPGESKRDFLERHGVGPGPVDPANGVPYYLLIVGDPATIPYTFQYQLDVQFSVGRIFFETLEEYAHYARSVVDAENGSFALPKRATFFGTRNPDDRATELSADELITPLLEHMPQEISGWDFHGVVGEGAAMKANLSHLLGGEETPAFLFTATHGVGFPNGHERQIHHQGSLVCQDWPGPRQHKGPLPTDYYFSSDDIGANARFLGLIAFFFACYGAGTPRMDNFSRQAFGERAAIAPHAFVAGLPQRMLGHAKGGALATIGHVERAWGYSFSWGRATSELEVFTSTITRLLKGDPIGLAMEYFNERYAEIATDLNVELEAIEFSKQPDEREIASLWTANNDARNYTIIGDPAVRLPINASHATPLERPTIGEVAVPAGDVAPIAPQKKHKHAYTPLTFAELEEQDTSFEGGTSRAHEGHPTQPTERTQPVRQALQTTTSEPSSSPDQPRTVAELLARWRVIRSAEEKIRTRAEECLQELEAALRRECGE